MMESADILHERKSSSRRAQPRVECNLAATIRFNGVELCDAIIKDISTSGLRLFIPIKSWLPQEFDVVTSALDKPLRVRTSWTNGDSVGVRFLYDKSDSAS